MMNIERYMDDGANWQAQSVLAYLRSVYDGKEKMFVGRYENSREQGYIFFVHDEVGAQRNYCVYEHRNSDQLCVVVFNSAKSVDTPNKKLVWDAMGDNKWNVTKIFGYGHIVECGNYIIDDIENFVE